MPAVTDENPKVITTSGSSKVKALYYFKSNSLKLMVHADNPGHEKVQVQIVKGQHRVLYQTYVGDQDMFVGKYNLQNLPDGIYTIQVKSATYTQSFTIQTSISREATIEK
jgi:hypothetical protein